ncbi:MAG: hypothetical protein V7K97_22645 [Nostoc sp.]
MNSRSTEVCTLPATFNSFPENTDTVEDDYIDLKWFILTGELLCLTH